MSKDYRFTAKYQDHFRFVDKAGTIEYLLDIVNELTMLKCLSDDDRHRLLDRPIRIRFSFPDWRDFKVELMTDEEECADDLDKLAHTLGMAILDLEEELYHRYQRLKMKDAKWSVLTKTDTGV